MFTVSYGSSGGETFLNKSQGDEAEEVKKVAQTVAFFFAIGGIFLLLLTFVFAGEWLGITSPSHENDGSFIGSLVSLLYRAGPIVGNILAVSLFGGVTTLFFANFYGLWRMKKWCLYITGASTILFFIFTLSAVGSPDVSPYLGITSLLSGFLLYYLYHFRQHFK